MKIIFLLAHTAMAAGLAADDALCKDFFLESAAPGRGPGTVRASSAVDLRALDSQGEQHLGFTAIPVFIETPSPLTNWAAIACSADGTKLVALVNHGPIYASSNLGLSWVARSTPGTGGSALAASADTLKLAVPVGAAVYTSNDGGISWNSNSAPVAFTYLTSSADGSRLVGLGSNHVYTSANSGVTWTQTSAPDSSSGYKINWESAASSADGLKLAAAGTDVSRYNFSFVYTSTNAGLTWNQTLFTAMNGIWSVASSADGAKLAALTWSGLLYTSQDSGINWAMITQIENYSHPIVSSADGNSLFAVNPNYNYPVQASADSGTNWVQTTAPRLLWTVVAVSSNATTLAAVARFSSRIYVSNAKLIPALEIRKSTDAVVLAWPAQSSPLDFVLQQAASLPATNWTDLPGAPAFDPTNLQNVLVLPSTNHSQFFRLRSL